MHIELVATCLFGSDLVEQLATPTQAGAVIWKGMNRAVAAI